MKRSEIQIGGYYTAKVSGRITIVQILSESAIGGWNATNTRTGRRVWIRGAARLRERAEGPRTITADRIRRRKAALDLLDRFGVARDATGETLCRAITNAPKVSTGAEDNAAYTLLYYATSGRRPDWIPKDAIETADLIVEVVKRRGHCSVSEAAKTLSDLIDNHNAAAPPRLATVGD